MAGRIRTIKPELLEDDRVASLSHEAFRLFVGLILLADDFGNFRASPDWLRGQVFWRVDAEQGVAEVLIELATIELITVYTVRGQDYGHINGWEKHQRVDKPGKPRCPSQADEFASVLTDVGQIRHFLAGASRLTTTTTSTTTTTTTMSDGVQSGGGGGVLSLAKGGRPDVDEATLGASDKQVRDAIVADRSLAPIVRRPNELARDLVIAGPGLSVVSEVMAAGAWLRANPTRAKSNGNQFLLGWVRRNQERNGGRPCVPPPPIAQPDLPPGIVPAGTVMHGLKPPPPRWEKGGDK